MSTIMGTPVTEVNRFSGCSSGNNIGMSISTRIKQARKAAKMTQEELAKKTGLKQSTISDLEVGRSHGTTSIASLAAALGVSPLWLEAGKGPMSAADGDLAPVVGSSVRAQHADDPIPDDVVQVFESRIKFSAGNGKVATFELVEDGEPALYRHSWLQKNSLKPERIRRFPVSGDSQEPTLYDGDVVLVNLEETEVVDGKLYAIRYDNDLRIKFLFRKLDGTLILRSKNPAYPDEEVSPEVANEYISIIGRVRDKSGKGGL